MMLKKIMKPLLIALLVACMAMTVVSGVFVGLSRAYSFSGRTLKAAAATSTVFEEAISVPYEEAEADYTVYVSPEGNNSADGQSLETAVASLNQAQALIREWYSLDNEGDAMILLDDGEYYVDSTVQLLEEDVKGGSLYIRSIHPNKATVSGSKRVDASTMEEVNDPKLGRVWKIPCTEQINQLYVNDGYGIRARYPNLGEEHRLLSMDTVLREIIIDSEDVEGFAASDFEGAVMTVAIMWSESYLRINDLSIGEKTSRVKFVGEDSFVFAREGLIIRPRCGYHFENSKAFLDVNGEWYWSEAESMIYYLPYVNETLENTTLRIPYTEVLIAAEGEIDSKISGITVEGVNFKYTKNGVVDGKVGGQANRNDNTATKRISGGLNDGRPVAAISFEYAENVTFSGNIFGCLGGGALDFVQGVKDISVTKNMFRAVGGNGILTGATSYDITIVPTDERTFNANMDISNNYFTEIGWQDYDACAIILNYAVDSSIVHNTINNVLYTGISVGWGWVETTYPFLRNIDISYNRLTNCNALLSDGGPIYTIGCQPYTKITNNYIGESYNSVWKYPEDISSAGQIWWANAGIYLDSASGGDSEESAWQIIDNYVAKDVNTQQYEDINAQKEYVNIVRAKESDKAKIYKASGVQEDGFTLIPKTAVLTGHRTNSEDVATVYGFNLGKKTEGALVIRDEDGEFTQVDGDDILEWTDRWVKFESEDYISGEVFLLQKDGYTSNRIFATLNVDVDYCMYERFDENWGGFTGLAKLSTFPQDLTNFRSSSYSAPYAADNIGDGYTSTVWEMNKNDTQGAWVAFDLLDRGKVSKFIIYARAELDQWNCRQNFAVYGIKLDGTEVLLYETPEADVPVYMSNDLFVLDMAEIGHADTVFTGFKIQKKPSATDAYLCIAEVAVI